MGKRRFALVCLLSLLGAICVIGAKQAVEATPDNAVTELNQEDYIGQSQGTIEAKLAALGFKVSRTRYYALAERYSGVLPGEQGFIVIASIGLRDSLEAVCEWECVFVQGSRVDTIHILGFRMDHEYLYSFVIENGFVVAMFGDVHTWKRQLYY